MSEIETRRAETDARMCFLLAAPIPEVAKVLRKTLADAEAAASKNQVLAKVVLKKADLMEHIDLIRGAVMICFPMGLPEYDNVRLAIEDTEDLEGSAVRDPPPLRFMWGLHLQSKPLGVLNVTRVATPTSTTGTPGTPDASTSTCCNLPPPPDRHEVDTSEFRAPAWTECDARVVPLRALVEILRLEPDPSQLGADILDPGSALLWWAGKQMMPGNKLKEHVGKNEKTKVICKLQKKSQGAPARESVRLPPGPTPPRPPPGCTAV